MRSWMIKSLFIATTLVVLLLIIKKKNMSVRQSILKAIYPVVMAAGKLFKHDVLVLENRDNLPPAQPLYAIKPVSNDGTAFDLEACRGKKLLIVNTASDCGYTGQYEELQELYEKYSNRLNIIAFPANDFKEQEQGTDDEISAFCKLNYGVSFPLMQKSTVVKSSTQNPVFQWLTQKEKNGWNDQEPSWNFSKYLVDENGKLVAYFAPSVSPMSDDVRRKVVQ